MLPSPGLTLKRKASEVGRVPPRPGPGPNRGVVSESDVQMLAPPKRLKRSYAFYKPLGPSRLNVTHGKEIYYCHIKVIHKLNKELQRSPLVDSEVSLSL